MGCIPPSMCATAVEEGFGHCRVRGDREVPYPDIPSSGIRRPCRPGMVDETIVLDKFRESFEKIQSHLRTERRVRPQRSFTSYSTWMTSRQLSCPAVRESKPPPHRGARRERSYYWSWKRRTFPPEKIEGPRTSTSLYRQAPPQSQAPRARLLHRGVRQGVKEKSEAS